MGGCCICKASVKLHHRTFPVSCAVESSLALSSDRSLDSDALGLKSFANHAFQPFDREIKCIALSASHLLNAKHWIKFFTPTPVDRLTLASP